MVPYTAGWEPSVSSSLGVAEPGAPQPGGGGPSRAPYLPGVEAGRANGRDTDELVELAADEGERGLNGGAAAAGLSSGKFRPSVPQVASRPAIAPNLKPWLIRIKAQYAYPRI